MAQSEKPSRAGGLIVRIVIVAVLVVAVVIVLKWRGLLAEHRRGIALYDDGKFTEAHAVLESVLQSPLAAIKIRPKARKSLGLCKSEMAAEIADKDRSAEGYTKALDLLAEAKELAGPSDEIDRRIQEYTEYLGKVGR